MKKLCAKRFGVQCTNPGNASSSKPESEDDDEESSVDDLPINLEVHENFKKENEICKSCDFNAFDIFRCFAYQNIYEGFLVSQSGEAICSLYTAKEGDKTMTLKRGKTLELWQ